MGFVALHRVFCQIKRKKTHRMKSINLQGYKMELSVVYLEMLNENHIFITQKQQLEAIQSLRQEFIKLVLLSHLIFSSQGL